MGEYADVRSSKLKRFVEGLAKRNPQIELRRGNHELVIKYLFGERPFPLPTSHKRVNKHIVKDLVERLVEWKVCTKEEFDQAVK